VVSEWIGDSGTVTGTWSESNHGSMILVRKSQYDGGGVGPGHLTSVTETVAYDANYDPVVTRTTTYAYDFRGRLITRTLPDPDGNPSTTGDTPVYVTRYDNLGRVVKESNATGLIDTLGHYTTYTYDDLNRTHTVTGPDADGSLSTTSDAPVSIIEYDARGLVIRQTDAMGRVTSYEYDGAGRRTKVFPPDPTTGQKNASLYMRFGYDGGGNLVAETNPLGHTTTYEYDRAHRLIVLMQPDPDGSRPQSAPVVTYAYDDGGRKLNLLDPAGNVTTWYYDALGRVTGEVVSLNNLAHNFSYDATGRLVEKIDRMGRRTRYQYNLLDQVLAEKWYASDGTTLVRTITFQYDALGNLRSADEPSAAAYDYVYDLLGRRIQEVQDLVHLTPDLTYDSQFDVLGRRTQLRARIGATRDFQNTYSYDLLGRLTSLVQESQTRVPPVASPTGVCRRHPSWTSRCQKR